MEQKRAEIGGEFLPLIASLSKQVLRGEPGTRLNPYRRTRSATAGDDPSRGVPGAATTLIGTRTLVVLSVSGHGTEHGTLHVFDTAMGAAVSEPVPHVKPHGRLGRLAWGRARLGRPGTG
jgi:hypothetical protein